MTDQATEPFDFNTLGAPAPAKSPLPGFKPLKRAHFVVGVLGALLFWTPLLAAAVIGIQNMTKFGEGIGRMFVFFLLVVGIASLIDRATRRWTRWPAAAFVLCAGALTISIFVPALTKVRNAGGLARFDQQLDSSLMQVEQLAGKSPDERTEVITSVTTNLKTLADELDLPDARVKLALFETTAGIHNAGFEYEELVKKYAESGGLVLSPSLTGADLDRRLDILRQARTHHSEYLRRIHDLRSDVERRASLAGVSLEQRTRDLDKLIAMAGAGSLLERVHERERDLLELQSKYLQLLRDTFGTWDMAPDGVSFSGPREQEHNAQLDKLVDELEAAMAAQEKVKQAITASDHR
jgi:hypothetical protein